MISNALDLISENRSKTVFLPPISFGYLYAEYGTSFLGRFLPFLENGMVLLGLAVLSGIFACFYYTLTDIRPSNPPIWLLYLVLVISLLFLLVSLIELFFRVGEEDIVVVGLFLFNIMLFALSASEHVITEFLD